jgi:ATP-dependent Zn protease
MAAARRPKKVAPKKKSVNARTRLAYHEAGHAVLSAAIANPPVHVTIRSDGHSNGRSGARMSARATTRVQVHLAGFAAEHLLTGRRSRQLDEEVGFAILARIDPALRSAFTALEIRDGHRAVQEVLGIGEDLTDAEIKREVDRFYEITHESLSVVWRAVVAVAKALLQHEELDRDAVEEAIGDVDLYVPVVAVQKAHGLLRAASAQADQ